jgi:hypothetical protein
VRAPLRPGLGAVLRLANSAWFRTPGDSRSDCARLACEKCCQSGQYERKCSNESTLRNSLCGRIRCLLSLLLRLRHHILVLLLILNNLCFGLICRNTLCLRQCFGSLVAGGSLFGGITRQRIWKIATGEVHAVEETRLMVTEKVEAAAEARAMLWTGKSPNEVIDF